MNMKDENKTPPSNSLTFHYSLLFSYHIRMQAYATIPIESHKLLDINLKKESYHN
jgi:hypothetical protein